MYLMKMHFLVGICSYLSKSPDFSLEPWYLVVLDLTPRAVLIVGRRPQFVVVLPSREKRVFTPYGWSKIGFMYTIHIHCNSNLITTMYGVCIFVFSSFHSQHSDILHPSIHYLELRIVCSMRLIMESVVSLHLSYWFCTVCKSSSLCFITTKHFLYFSL